MSSSATVDPAIAGFVARLGAVPNIAADSVAGLILRLLARVSRLEQAVQQHGKKLEALAKQPKPTTRARTHDAAPQTRIVETGIDFDGNPVRIEERIRRPRGRPAGSRDQVPRARRRWDRKPEGAEDIENLESLAASDALLDPNRDR
jgi:hypothetical protein